MGTETAKEICLYCGSRNVPGLDNCGHCTAPMTGAKTEIAGAVDRGSKKIIVGRSHVSLMEPRLRNRKTVVVGHSREETGEWSIGVQIGFALTVFGGIGALLYFMTP